MSVNDTPDRVDWPVVVELSPEGWDFALRHGGWVAEVARTADFGQLPEDPLIVDLAYLALAIDGYAWMARLAPRRAKPHPWGGSVQQFIDRYLNPNLKAIEAGRRPRWSRQPLILWCCLFMLQRSGWREGWKSLGGGAIQDRADRAKDDPAAQSLWPALRRALMAPPVRGANGARQAYFVGSSNRLDGSL